MPSNIIQFIWKYSRPQQLWLVGLTFVSFPLLYLSLEIPKIIINEALSGQSGKRSFLFWELSPFSLLVVLSFSLLALVLINGAFKMYINTQKGIVGETLVRRLRYTLMERLLRFTPRKFERLSQGEVIATVVQETDPIGGFSGDAFAKPLFQGGTLLTILLFMFMQNWLLGLASIALVPLQLFIIPRLQRQINLLKKQRVKRVRGLSNRIGETVSAVDEIRIQGTRRYTLAEFSYRFGDLYFIRLELFKKKFFMKFVNNTLNQLTPFMFYLLGGYLVLNGQLTVGALVASIAAHKDFLSPWRELLNFYQIWQDNVIRYQQVVEQFSPRNILQLPTATEPVDKQVFQQALRLEKINIRNANNEPVLSHLNFELKPGEWVAVSGPEIFYRRAFARCLTGLESPFSGFVGFGEHALANMPERDLRLQIGYVNAQPRIFNASISYNLGYGLNHLPPVVDEGDQKRILKTARKAGNSEDWFDESFSSVWTDWEHLGTENWSDLDDSLGAMMDVVGNREVLLNLSLNEVFNPLAFPEEIFAELVDDLLVARCEMLAEIQQQQPGTRVNHYDATQLNRFAPMLDNLIFGTLVGDAAELRPVLLLTIIDVLEENKLLEPSLRIAERGLRKLVLQLRSLPEDHPFIEQFELHDEERVTRLKQLSNALDGDVDAAVSDRSYRYGLMDIFLRLVPQDWLEIWMEPNYLDGLIALRPLLVQRLEDKLGDHYFPFIENKYNPGLSVINNVLYGRIDPLCTKTQQNLHERATYWVFEKASQYDLIRLFMINTQAGVSGVRLPEVAHHSVSLLRTLVKRPGVLVMQDALGGRNEAEKFALLERLRSFAPDLSLVWINDELTSEHSAMFDRTLQLTADGLVDSQQSTGS